MQKMLVLKAEDFMWCDNFRYLSVLLQGAERHIRENHIKSVKTPWMEQCKISYEFVGF